MYQVYHQKSEYKERDFEGRDISLITVQADTMVPCFKDEEVKAPKNLCSVFNMLAYIADVS